MSGGASSFGGRVASTSLWSTGSVAVSAVTGVLTARALGPELRGSLALILAIGGLCVLIAAFGTNVAIRRHLPRNDGVNRAGYERISAILLGPLALTLVVVAFVVADFVDPNFGTWQVLASFLAYGIAYFFSNQILDLLNAVGLVAQSARVNALGSFVCLVLVALCTVAGWGIVPIVLSYAVSVALQAITAYAIVKRNDGTIREPAKGMKTLVKDGGRLLGLNLGQSLTYRSDIILLGILTSQHEVGIYSVATTPAAILRIPSNAMGQVVFHSVASGAIERRGVYKRVLQLILLLLPIAFVGWIAADWLFLVIFGAPFQGAADAFRVLLIAEIALVPFLVFSRALAGGGSTWGASACGLIGVGAMLVSGIMLIPALGAIGAAWASLTAYGAMSVLAFLLFATRKHR